MAAGVIGILASLAILGFGRSLGTVLLGPLVNWGNDVTAGAGYAGLFSDAAIMFVASALALRGIAAPVRGLAASRLAP
jgi:hypothetical protein